jgi:hypothetical protein
VATTPFNVVATHSNQKVIKGYSKKGISSFTVKPLLQKKPFDKTC